MATYTAVLDFHAALSLPHPCPRCDGPLEPRALGALVAFACPTCDDSWRFELGRAVPLARAPGAQAPAPREDTAACVSD